ncbi:unnamed protein product [Mytilus coruscus]|uniref:WSC domain-containing protein n=1 Tax=Mytilus coruscus TaxID=42192 RepID=A0A6J8CRI6_MYTCO|nr:unnamed protein product [Mytilus coruscus]
MCFNVFVTIIVRTLKKTLNLEIQPIRYTVHVGCFIDNSNRLYDFPNPPWDIKQQTVSKCAGYCNRRNFIYSGLEFKTQCFCGNVEPPSAYDTRSDSGCNMACGGNSSETCGDCSVLSPYPPNCAKIDCKTPANKSCTACTEKEYYKVSGRDCKDKCSSRNRWCWPGSCGKELASNCNCMTGFKSLIDRNTAKCQPIQQPSIASCQTFAFGRNGSMAVSNTGSPECSFQRDIYGRFQVGHFQINLNVFFQVSIGHQYKDPRPRFVPQEQFGITDLYVDVYKLSVTNQSQFIIREFVKLDPNSDQPEETVASKNLTVYANEILADGER